MPTYTFAELLTRFFYLHQNPANRKTRAEFAESIGINRRTMSAWFTGQLIPHTQEAVERITNVLDLTMFQADLLLYAANPRWSKYGTPTAILAHIELLSEQETESEIQTFPPVALPIPYIETIWTSFFCEDFASNYQRWGIGYKDNGTARLSRAMIHQRYQLMLQNRHHIEVTMGGDSNCFTPPLYYLSVHAQLIEGNSGTDGYGLMFEAINDECYTFFRVCEQTHHVSIIQARPNSSVETIYLRQLPEPMLQPGAWNKLAVLALHDEHWFYLNNQLIGHQVLPRLPMARLDIGISAGVAQSVICEFKKLQVVIP